MNKNEKNLSHRWYGLYCKTLYHPTFKRWISSKNELEGPFKKRQTFKRSWKRYEKKRAYLQEEAKRNILQIPEMKPGMLGGKPRAIQYKVPFNF